VVELPGGRALSRETIDVSPYGVKVKLDGDMEPGTAARLPPKPPDRRPLDLRSVVGRADTDGHVLLFVDVSGDELERLKTLVDDHRRA
jgi:hypothetical protein